MKKLLIVLGTLLVIVLGVLAILPRMLDINRYHDQIQAELQKQLGRPVQLGQMNLGLLPPTFKVQNAVIAEDPNYNSGLPFAQAAELDVAVKLEPLLHKDVQVESLRMIRPSVELIHAADGTWNFASLGKRTKPTPNQQQASSQPTPLALDLFQIDDGAVGVTDLQKHQPRMVYNNIDLQLKNVAMGKPFEIALTAHLPGAGKQLVKLDGRSTFVNDPTLVNTPFQGTLQIDQVTLSSAQQYMNSKALSGTEANISGSLKFNSEGGKLSADGTVQMDNVTTHGKPLGYPVVLDYHAVDDLQADLVTIGNTQLKVGNSPFLISGTVNGQSTPAQANLKLNAQGASIADLVKLGEAFGMSLSPGTQPSGQLSADLTARGPLSAPAVAGVLQANQLKVSGFLANSAKVNLNLAPPGGDFVRTLTGKISVQMNDGKLTGVDMSQKLGQIGKFTGANKAGAGATQISQLSGDFDLQNGVATTNDLKALTDAGTLAATGTISLVDQGLNMKATAILSKANSQQAGGTNIGGLMTTAMANNNGEIVIPVLVTGTIPSPKVDPDVAEMAKLRTSNLLPSFSNPGQLTQGALGKLGGGSSGAAGALGALTGKPTPSAAASNQGQQSNGNSTQNTVNGVVGLFGGKKSTK
jgi:uncharacterized protein involved in outer membrane biogenesis